MIDIPPWLGSLIISFVIGAVIGMLIKHFLKFGIILLVVVVVLLSLGYVQQEYFGLVLNLISPEISSIWKDSVLTTSSGVLSSILFFVGLGLSIWKT